MRLTDYIQILWKRKWVIIVTTMITTAFAVFSIMQIVPQYRAIARVRLPSLVVGGTDYLDYSVEYSERITKTYAELTGSNVMRQLVQVELGLEELPEYEVNVIDKTELFDVVVDTDDPQLSIDIVNAVVKNLEKSDRSILRNIFSQFQLVDDSNSSITVVDLASDSSIIMPSSINFIVFGVLTGAVAGSALVFVLNSFDRRIYSVDVMEELTRKPVIGQIPKFSRVKQQFLFVIYPFADAFRQIRVNLLAILQRNRCSVFAVGSVDPDMDAVTIVVNLAYSLTQIKKSVLLVDANMNVPSIHSFFKFENEQGLNELLRGQVDLEDVILQVENTDLSIIPAGEATAYSTELLQSAPVGQLIKRLYANYDVVIFYVPAASVSLDMSIMSRWLDGVILITVKGFTDIQTVQKVLRQLKYTGSKLIGTIMKQSKVQKIKQENMSQMDPLEMQNFLAPVKKVISEGVRVPNYDNDEETVADRDHALLNKNNLLRNYD